MSLIGQSQILERGNCYFFYRPTVEETSPEGLQDIQRFYLVLSPVDRTQHRLIVVGRKKLPDPRQEGRPYWAFVEKVVGNPEALKRELSGEVYVIETRGERRQPGARPAGEGVYALARHGDHTHLAYHLELPQTPGEAQAAFHITPEANYVITVKNPEAASPPWAGLQPEQKVEYPFSLQDAFEDRRFIPLDPPDFLNYVGTEILLISTDETVSELDIALHTEEETRATADIFRELQLERSAKTITPLFKGEWT